MTTIHITTHSRLSPDRVLEAGHDFSARRAEIFPAISIPYFEVHELSQCSADVTEGTPSGVGVNWERCRYDWSLPGSVKAVVTDSNVYAQASSSSGTLRGDSLSFLWYWSWGSAQVTLTMSGRSSCSWYTMVRCTASRSRR
jgi:hypothetical protein